ncbi:MAG: NAD-specific glutamate dehydrogenase [Candidatus Accumulibacter sp. SK-11]|nr:MAG: NAD-specific glutamate dehydrogenase [Candidatus Accumulibacter sp. SK-11]
MLRARGVGSDVWQVDLGLLPGRQLDLGLFRGILETLQRQHIGLQVDPALFLELVDDVVDQPLVEILATEEGIAVGRQHFELVLSFNLGNLDDRDVESATTEVIDGNLLVALFLVHAESKGSGRRLVDDPLDFEPGDPPGILGCLPLAVVEVGGNGDHRLADFLAEIVLGGLLHLAQDLRRYLRRRNLLAAHLDPGVAIVGLENAERHQRDVLLYLLLVEAPADQPLDRVQGVLRVGYRLPLGRGTAQNLVILGVGDDRRGRPCAFGVFDDFRLAILHHGDTGVGRPEIDADDLAHS